MTLFRGLPAAQIENDEIRVTVAIQGGHLAEVFHKRTGVNPLWFPPWPSIDVRSYSPEKYPEYGADAESKLLAGIMGHNLCLDLFGPPSPEEAKAGLTVHGEMAMANFDIQARGDALGGELVARTTLPIAQLSFKRHLRLLGSYLLIKETVENLSALDRPIAWTQHVTMGPPFIERGVTQFRTSATKSRTMDGRDFDWPRLPQPDGSERDLQLFNDAEASGGYTAHLLDPNQKQAWFFAFSPPSRVLFSYVWNIADFPWLGIWEENHSRQNPPWNGRTTTLGMEFGVSPFPESRREMIERNSLFGKPAYRWLPARRKLTIDYHCAIGQAEAIPESLESFPQLIP